MPRFYFHLRDHIDEAIDPEGCEFTDMEHVKAGVLAAARDVMGGDLSRGIIDFRYRIDVEDAAGRVVYSLGFEHAVTIIPDAVLGEGPMSSSHRFAFRFRDHASDIGGHWRAVWMRTNIQTTSSLIW